MSNNANPPALPDPELVGAEYRKTATMHAVKMDAPFEVETLEGKMSGQAGDYLAKGCAGELYPIKADIFEASYDLAEGLCRGARRSVGWPKQPEVELDAHVEGERISMSADSFEHLLGCLANQKFTCEFLPHAEAEQIPDGFDAPTREQVQGVIDACWRQGMSLLSRFKRDRLARGVEGTRQA